MKDRPIRILAMDGGGVRGIITARWLERLERELRAPLGSVFHTIAGTSIGSILAGGLTTGIAANDLRNWLVTGAQDVFTRSKPGPSGSSGPKYSIEGLSALTKSLFADKKLIEADPRLIIHTFSPRHRRSVLWRSWEPRWNQASIASVCRASCTAPGYFPSAPVSVDDDTIDAVDGGMIVRNPSAFALAAVVGSNPDVLKKVTLVSFGTGEFPLDVADYMDDEGDVISRGILGKDQYFRLQLELTPGVGHMDDASESHLVALQRLADQSFDETNFHHTWNEMLDKLIA